MKLYANTLYRIKDYTEWDFVELIGADGLVAQVPGEPVPVVGVVIGFEPAGSDSVVILIRSQLTGREYQVSPDLLEEVNKEQS